jgi:hypothetical protein
METKKGIVTNIRSSVDVSGGNYGIFVNTAQVTLFSIDDYPVMMINKKPPVIQEGDEVILSGEIDNGRLNAYAYKNLTTSSEGDKGYIRRFIASAILLLIWYLLWFIFAPQVGGIAKIISALFFGFGIYYFYVGNKILQAVKNVKSTP